MFLDQIHNMVREDKARRNVGIRAQEIQYDRFDMQPPEHDGSGDDQMPARRAVLPGGRTLGVIDLIQYAPARRHIGPAASVSESLRLVRTTNCVRKCASSSATLRLTVASGMPSAREAADRLPPSTAAISVAIASNRSIEAPENRKEDS